LKASKQPDLTKILSPRYEGNDIKTELLTQALESSFLDGKISASEYYRGKNLEERTVQFTPLRVRFASTSKHIRNATNPYLNHKVQYRARQLLKDRLRILNLSRIEKNQSEQKSRTRNLTPLSRNHTEIEQNNQKHNECVPIIKAQCSIHGILFDLRNI